MRMRVAHLSRKSLKALEDRLMRGTIGHYGSAPTASLASEKNGVTFRDETSKLEELRAATRMKDMEARRHVRTRSVANTRDAAS